MRQLLSLATKQCGRSSMHAAHEILHGTFYKSLSNKQAVYFLAAVECSMWFSCADDLVAIRALGLRLHP